VNEQRRNQTSESRRAGSATLWVRPEINRLEAGAAEFGDVSNADSQPGFS